MAVIYHRDAQNDSETPALKENIKAAKNAQGEASFTPVVALSFLVFILIYFPCIGVIAVIRKESGSWKWALFTIGYTTGLAWIMSFIVYNIGNLIV
jgi:ferrous iron transport protein B